MSAVFLALAVALFVIQTIALRSVRAGNIRDKLFVNGGFALLGGVALLVLKLIKPEIAAISGATLGWGIAFGVVFALTILFYNSALETGPLSYTSFYYASSMIIPAIVGITLLGEPIGKIPLALIIFLVAFFFLNFPSGEKAVRKKGWALFCFLSFLCNGTLAIIQKMHQRAVNGTEAIGIMLVGFLTAAIVYVVLYLLYPIFNKGSKGEKAGALLATNWKQMIFLALGSVGGNLIITILAGKMGSSVLFPILQGSLIITVTLLSQFVYKEKLNKKGWIGMALGVLAIVVINL